MTTPLPSDGICDRNVTLLHAGWQLCHTLSGACAAPEQLNPALLNWQDAIVPGTVASTVHENIDIAGDYDADDWWYRLRFAAQEHQLHARCLLRFDGLATHAQVWLNGTLIITSCNMFVGHSVDVTDLLRDDNLLVIVFRSLHSELSQRRPRPRWKTALVTQQNLRWIRTTLLGRIPGWTPPITPVGPWRGVALETIEHILLTDLEIQTWVEGNVGRLRITATTSSINKQSLNSARLRVGDTLHILSIDAAETTILDADIFLPNIPLWWPHTHGNPTLLPCQIELLVGNQWVYVDCGKLGFKQISLDQDHGNAELMVNDIAVFCRGACWTTTDFLGLQSDTAELRRTLELFRNSGGNMLRIGGTMIYESSDFYQLCDELGILVWQDFMFANMDYPFDDPMFITNVRQELTHQLRRLQRHVCVTVYCGGSEIAQQAAMLGLPESEWSNNFFNDALPRYCKDMHRGIPYFPSTPWGGALPFHVSTGISHYYGVGAYRRPLTDIKLAQVKFATECLGFSNVPAVETIALMLNGATPPSHHPRWKARQPRDNGAGWDFEDIRDYYLKQLFNVDPIALRSQDIERYYALSRVVTGEVMRRVFAEWRSPTNPCSGALIWFLRDLWPGAGWGIIDSTGRPKAVLWYLKRAWATQSIHITDEGLDGLNLHIVNDHAAPLKARVEFAMLQAGRIVTGTAQTTIHVSGRNAVTLQADALLGYFSDSNAAYRFGPNKHEVVTARLVNTDSQVLLSEDHLFPTGMSLPQQYAAKITTEAEWLANGKVAVTLFSDVFLQAVSISCKGFTSDDDYFHLMPGQEKYVLFCSENDDITKFRAHFAALNLPEIITVRIEKPDSNASVHIQK